MEIPLTMSALVSLMRSYLLQSAMVMPDWLTADNPPQIKQDKNRKEDLLIGTSLLERSVWERKKWHRSTLNDYQRRLQYCYNTKKCCIYNFGESVTTVPCWPRVTFLRAVVSLYLSSIFTSSHDCYLCIGVQSTVSLHKLLLSRIPSTLGTGGRQRWPWRSSWRRYFGARNI